MAKRKRGEASQVLGAELVRVYRDLGPEFIWDATSRLKLLWPDSSFSEPYFYIGREKAEKLFHDVKGMKVNQVMQILGAKGSGKSTVMATIAAYLHGHGERDVVYFSGLRFASAPLYTLREALFLCSSAGNLRIDDPLFETGDLPSLVEWCADRSLLLVVDDWDNIETAGGEIKRFAEEASRGNSLVRVSSANSRERYAWETSDKVDDYIRTIEFDGPYTEIELLTWVAHSNLPQQRLDMLDYFTGGMPRLVRVYSEADDAESYMQKIARPYTNKIDTELVSRLTTKASVKAALQLVTSYLGAVIPPQLEGMRLTCFFKRGYFYHILCPYLRNKAEGMIVEAGSLKLLVADLQVWLAAVLADLRAPVGARNSARIGWNVEGLTIGVIRVQAQVLPEHPFQTYATYGHGREVEALSSLEEAALRNGVLLAPRAFNEKAVDIVYVHLVGSKMKIVAIQITVAQWKARESKASHETWRRDVLPKWEIAFPGVEVDSTFLYVMPEQVKLEDVVDEEVVRFGTICSRLFFLDKLCLETPSTLKKAVKRKCSGDGQTACGNTSGCSECADGILWV